MTEFPQWGIGFVNTIDNEYEVHWLDWDRARLTTEGEEIVTFSSASAYGFTSTESVMNEAADVAYLIEEGDEW